MNCHPKLTYKCACGAVKVQIKPSPLVRMFCHCSICQKLSKQSYADDILVLAKDVIIENPTAVSYKKHTTIFPLQRGECQHCQSPVVAFSTLIPLVKIAVTPTQFYGHQVKLPKAVAHVFYDKKEKIGDDSLPKYSHYLSSQIITVKFILTIIIKKLLCKW